MQSPPDLELNQLYRERLIIPDYVKVSVMAGRNVAKKKYIGWLPICLSI